MQSMDLEKVVLCCPVSIAWFSPPHTYSQRLEIRELGSYQCVNFVYINMQRAGFIDHTTLQVQYCVTKFMCYNYRSPYMCARYYNVQISGTMAKFEGLFQDLDVHTEVMDSTMSAATTLNTPEDQVTGLMKEVHA